MMWCDMIRYDAVRHDTIRYVMIWYDMIWYDMIWYDITLYYDTVLTGKITDDDDCHCRHEIDSFVDWCDNNYFELSVDKTRKLLIDFKKNKVLPSREQRVNGVEISKYLGIILDSALRRKKNTDAILREAHTRFYCLRKPRSFNVSRQLVQLFCTSTIASALTFGLTCWGREWVKQDSSRINWSEGGGGLL